MKGFFNIFQLREITGLSPEDNFRRNWTWFWSIGTLCGIVVMTILTVTLKIWGFIWVGMVLILSYSIYLPLFKNTLNFKRVSGVFNFIFIGIIVIGMIIMGGFFTSFGLIFIGMNYVMSSFISTEEKWVRAVFGYYFLSIIIVAVIHPFLSVPEFIKDGHNLLFFTINAIWFVFSAFLFVEMIVLGHINYEGGEQPFRMQGLLLKINRFLDKRTFQKIGFHPLSLSGLFQKKITEDSEFRLLAKINLVIEKNIMDEDFGIKILCKELGMSRTQLYKKFSDISEVSIGHYIQSVRLEKAKNLLENTNANVTEAAMDTGFKNLSHFSQLFKETYGINPSSIKKSAST